MNYLTSIKYATLVFPLIALLFTTPFIFIELHKYGAISLLKSTIIYLFIYYLICAYFLVILPLPKINEVANLSTPKLQYIPFHFIIDFINHSSLNIRDPSTYITSLKESYFYVPIFNVLLTIPFGMFIKYYFQWNLKKIVFITFLLSLFFEITQLSGLYFLYPRSYRLCDIDDLILNTFGGFIGCLISKPFLSILPKIETINQKSKEKGQKISGFRRTSAFLLDVFIISIIKIISIFVISDTIYLSIILIIIYYFIIPLFFNATTLGQKFLNIQIVDYNYERNNKRLILRKVLFIFFYFVIPFIIENQIVHTKNDNLREIIGMICIGIIFLIDCFSIIKYLFTNKDMLYEKISKTKLVSTIKIE